MHFQFQRFWEGAAPAEPQAEPRDLMRLRFGGRLTLAVD